MSTDARELFSELLSCIADILKPLGYRRQDQTFWIFAQSNYGILEFQRSLKSSKDAVLFTMNVGVICKCLLDSPKGLKKPSFLDAHVRQRIGFLLPEYRDNWWEIDNATDMGSLSREIQQVVAQKAVPYVARFLDSKAIQELWESGQAPGITEVERMRYLSKLKRLSNCP